MGVYTRNKMCSPLLVAVVLWVSAAPALAAPAPSDLIPDGASESEIRAIETAMLGPEHAAEHAAARRFQREISSGEAEGTNSRAALSSEEAIVAAADPSSKVGEWTEPPFALPTYAINSAVLPTGKVLFWGRPPPVAGEGRPNVGEAALWDPSQGTGPGAFTDVTPPTIDVDGPGGQPPAPAPIFCSGQSFLPDGQVLLAGGTLIYAGTFADDAYTDWGGLQTIFTFDPWTETWTRQPDMTEGRWYPTQTLLPDGRTVLSGGYLDDAPGGIMSENLETFAPPGSIGGQGTVAAQPTADRNGIGLYPRMFTLRDGNVLMAGPETASSVAVLETDTFTWNEAPPNLSQQRLASNAVRRPLGPAGSDTVTVIGGFNRPGVTGPFYPASATSETIDGADPDSWTADASLNVARANSNTVLLPDGSMVVVGGGSGFMQGGGGGYVTYEDGRARQVELYDPDSNTWQLGPAQQEDRAYHSTAVLLPDGRVFSAGDDRNPVESNGGASLTDSGEIYSPPYLFGGPRPTIDQAPESVAWGDAFGVRSASADVESAVLMAPAATTHGNDMSQRHLELEVVGRVDGKGINLKAPPSAGVAPPGYYMLFLLSAGGVPSKASWVRLSADALDQPLLESPATVPPPASSPDCDRAEAKLVKAKRRLRAARERLRGARKADDGTKIKRAKTRVRKAKRKVRAAKRSLESCRAG